MLRHTLIHPTITEILARAGHHATILIADGHYPASTKKGPNAQVVSLNLMPGVVTCAQVMKAILSAVPIDIVNTMAPVKDDPYAIDGDPPVWDEYRTLLREEKLTVTLKPIEKWEFYKAVESPDHVLTVQTADMQRFANVLLSVGVRME